MSAGAGYLESAFRGLLSADIFEIHPKVLRLLQYRCGIAGQGSNAVAVVQEMHHLHERLHRIDVHARYHRRFMGIGLRHDQVTDLAVAGGHGNRQCSTHAPDAAIQRQLAH